MQTPKFQIFAPQMPSHAKCPRGGRPPSPPSRRHWQLDCALLGADNSIIIALIPIYNTRACAANVNV